MYSFVFTLRALVLLMTRPPKSINECAFFAPVFDSTLSLSSCFRRFGFSGLVTIFIAIVIVIVLSKLFGLTVSKRSWFRYPTPLTVWCQHYLQCGVNTTYSVVSTLLTNILCSPCRLGKACCEACSSRLGL